METMTDPRPSLFDEGPPPPCPARSNLAAHVLRTVDQAPDHIPLTVGPAAEDDAPETLP